MALSVHDECLMFMCAQVEEMLVIAVLQVLWC